MLQDLQKYNNSYICMHILLDAMQARIASRGKVKRISFLLKLNFIYTVDVMVQRLARWN